MTSPPTPTPSLPPPTTRCPNCGTPVVAWLPASCPRCGFQVVHRDPLWDDRPLSWTKRILFLAWPLIGMAIGISLEDARVGLGAIAVTIWLVCLPTGFLYPPLMLFPVSRRPPLFSAQESAQRAASRRRRTVGLTVALGLLIPLLHLALCVFSIVHSL